MCQCCKAKTLVERRILSMYSVAFLFFILLFYRTCFSASIHISSRSMSLPAQAGLVERTFLYSIAGSPKYFLYLAKAKPPLKIMRRMSRLFLFLFKLSYQPCRYIPVLGVYGEQVFRHAYNVSRAYFDL